MNRYFESSYLTWEITSNKNLRFILDAFGHIDYLEENERNTWKHTETSDYYFEQRPIGGDRPFSILDLHILNTGFISDLLSHGLVSEEENLFVEDGQMEKYRQHIRNAGCFSNSSYAIFFSSKDHLVKDIWFNYEDHLSLESDRLAISGLLNHLGEKYSFVLIDWYEKMVVDLSNKETILRYLNDMTGKNRVSQPA